MKANIRKILYAMLLGVCVYFGLALYSGLGKIRDSLAIFHIETFFFACGLAFGNYVLRFLKWEFYLSRLGILDMEPGLMIVGWALPFRLVDLIFVVADTWDGANAHHVMVAYKASDGAPAR